MWNLRAPVIVAPNRLAGISVVHRKGRRGATSAVRHPIAETTTVGRCLRATTTVGLCRPVPREAGSVLLRAADLIAIGSARRRGAGSARPAASGAAATSVRRNEVVTAATSVLRLGATGATSARQLRRAAASSTGATTAARCRPRRRAAIVAVTQKLRNLATP